MTHSEAEPLSRETLLARAAESGIAVPAGQIEGVLKGARNLRKAAERLQTFLAEGRS